ncbi:(2Fe-2S) ferredoxin domain-containing protein [Mangrovimicrobium sediminis]|uniref:(2Fe-2S) ferredoxin domain-containing protein n=1 Tax=Mangrovimicrobium sediminis TaxID=2562682 RepID=A0A4Z0M6H8_9GAMM|nr:(2Fe-2S) ferredoxin domain-containing protein [Haliea sp. SAOS-164]TGD75121.1 (2Fe-2S) ferredoxin domain-containing protein [Haliea sp. SAOS-164]
MSRPEYHVFVCSQQRPAGHPRSSCGEKGASALMPVLSQSVMARNLLRKVSIVPTACLGPCSEGANLLVFPGAYLYSGVQPQDVEMIVERHLAGGEPVTEKLAPESAW